MMVAPLTVIEGDSMDADAAAWSALADTARWALKLPGLSPASAADLLDVWVGSRIAAGLPDEPHPQCGDA